MQKESRSAYLLRLLNQRRMAKSHLLSTLTEKINVAMETVHSELNQNISDGERSRLENTQQILFGLQAALHKAEIEDAVRRDRDYQRAVSILYRNPTAISRQNKEAFRELLTLKREKSNRKAESKRNEKERGYGASSLFFILYINSIKDQSLHLPRHFFFVQRFFTAVLQQ